MILNKKKKKKELKKMKKRKHTSFNTLIKSNDLRLHQNSESNKIHQSTNQNNDRNGKPSLQAALPKEIIFDNSSKSKNVQIIESFRSILKKNLKSTDEQSRKNSLKKTSKKLHQSNLEKLNSVGSLNFNPIENSRLTTGSTPQRLIYRYYNYDDVPFTKSVLKKINFTQSVLKKNLKSTVTKNSNQAYNKALEKSKIGNTSAKSVVALHFVDCTSLQTDVIEDKRDKFQELMNNPEADFDAKLKSENSDYLFETIFLPVKEEILDDESILPTQEIKSEEIHITDEIKEDFIESQSMYTSIDDT